MMLDGIECGEYGTRAFIKFAETDTDANSSLTLSSKETLGEAGNALIIDIPAALTLELPLAGDIHVDALRLILGMVDTDDNTKYVELAVGDAPILAVDLVTHPDNPMINEFVGLNPDYRDEEKEGDHLSEIDRQILQMALEQQSIDEILTWIMSRADRDEWLQALSKTILASLLGEEEGLPADWIAGFLSNSDVLALLSDDDILALAKAAAELDDEQLAEVSDAEELVSYLDPTVLDYIFAGLSDEQKQYAGLEEDATTITAEELLALIEHEQGGISLIDILSYLLGIDPLTGELIGGGDPDYDTLFDTLPAQLKAFLAELMLRGDEESFKEAILDAIANDADAVYDRIFGLGGIISEIDPEAEADEREKAPGAGGYVLSYEDARAILEKLLSLQLTAVQQVDSEGEPILDLDGNPLWTNGPACFTSLGTLLGRLLTSEKIEALYLAALEAAKYPQEEVDKGIEDPAPREFTVHIGTSTGVATIYNDGSINITQDKGNLTINSITSERGSVNILNHEGSILAQYESGIHDGHHILARDIHLKAAQDVGTAVAPLKLEQRENGPVVVVGVDEDIYLDPDYIEKLENGIDKFDAASADKVYVLRQIQQLDDEGNAMYDEQGRALYTWVLDVLIRYDWIRVDDPDPEERLTLTVEAGGDAFFEELTGSVRGSITAGGDAGYTVLDGEVGSIDDPLVLDIGGTMTINSRDDISVFDKGDLILIANSANGQVNVEAIGNIDLSNTNGQDLIIGPVVAGGNARIEADGNLLEGDAYGAEAQVTAVSIELIAKGTIGTEDDPFEVDTDADKGGTLTAIGESIVLTEISGNMLVDHIESLVGDIVLLAPQGSILEVGDAGKDLEDAAEAQKEANNAQSDADKAADQAAILDEYAKRLEELHRLAEEARMAAEEALENAKLERDQLLADKLQAEDEAKNIQDALDNNQARIEAIENILRQIEEIEADETLTPAEREALIATLLGTDTVDELTTELDTLDALRPDLEADLKDALDVIDALDGTLTKMEVAILDLQTVFDEALQAEEDARILAEAARKLADDKLAEALLKQNEANLLQAYADALLANDSTNTPSVITPGSLNMTAQGSIGEHGRPFSLGVEGTVDARAPEGIHIAGYGDLNLGIIETFEDIYMAALGNINTSGTPLIGESADINSLGGDIGSEANPFLLAVKRLSAYATGNIFAHNMGSLEIGSIQAGGLVDLEVDGGISAEPGTNPNIIASELNLKEAGNVGTTLDPLRVDVDLISVWAKDIFLHFLTDTTIHQIDGKDIGIAADGNVWGDGDLPLSLYHIVGDSLRLSAFGNIGKPAEPLRVYIRGTLDTDSEYGEVHVVNGYREPSVEPTESDAESSKVLTATRIAQTGDSTLFIGWFFFMSLIVGLGILVLSGRRKQRI